MDDQRNMLLAFALSMLVLIGFDYLVLAPQRDAREQAATEQAATEQPAEAPGAAADRPRLDSDRPTLADNRPSAADDQPGPASAAASGMSRDEALAKTPRVMIRTPRLTGSISLTGGQIDDLVLTDYYKDVDREDGNIVLLNPRGMANAYYADFGWAGRPSLNVPVPGPETRWQSRDRVLTPENPVELTWDNGAGLRFIRRIEIDRDYMFTITQIVENSTGRQFVLAPYGFVQRHGTPETSGFFILHEGLLGVLDGTLEESDYDDLREDGPVTRQSLGGWVGITDKYWLTALLPPQEISFQGEFRHRGGRADRYQASYLEAEYTVPAEGRVQAITRLFAGAKEVGLIERYEDAFEVRLFDRAIDWGWFIFLTKPIFYALDWLYGLFGNFGVAILVLTVLIKLAFYPLANKSYVSMSRMKKLQPKMKALQERFKDDKPRLQQEMMKLYKDEKINPASGCLPILVQIPVFFALYKVLFVTIEMRHQPFFGWIKDLSAPDPLTPVNLFGLVPWDPPSFLAVGIWPLLMGITMFLQMRLNPQATDPVQRKVFMFMPVIFTFILAPFPAGLVIYWTWNTLLSGLQQWVIMRRMGVSAGND